MRFRLTPMKKAWLLVGLAAAAALLVIGGCTASRISAAAQLARESEPFQHNPPNAALRLLIVGDSTGVGTGASAPKHSVAGLLAQSFPRLAIENRARDGATFAGVVQQLERGGRFDLVLLMAGGNDVIRFRSEDAMSADVQRSLALAHAMAPRVAVMPAGNVGNAPFFFAPLSGVMSARSRTLHAVVSQVAAAASTQYINLYQEAETDPFARDKDLHAKDGLHPSDAGYRVWRDELLAQSGWASVLQAAQ
ncbi:MAG: lysophospholipase L1-like esterase [Hydrogenophaga sp.]|jgi:lysophospholipase L1-like esterase